jgi:hypothetical protein
MGPKCCAETSVRHYHYKLRSIPEESDLTYLAVEVSNHALPYIIASLIQTTGS